MNNLSSKISRKLLQLVDPPSKSRVNKLIERLHPYACPGGLIRIGSDGDGGYLLPDDLEEIAACFSPGVDEQYGFDMACAARGIPVFMADASIEAPEELHDNMSFLPKFIGSENKSNHITMESWVQSARLADDADLMLQMDIEGAEYNVIKTMPVKLLKRFRILVIEFHMLNYLMRRDRHHEMVTAFEKLLDHFYCVHIHPNNCCGMVTISGIDFPVIAEFTFYRKDRMAVGKKAEKFPHPLDRDNRDKPALVLPQNWYSRPGGAIQ